MRQIYHDFIISSHESNLEQFSKRLNEVARNTLLTVSKTKNHLKSYSNTLDEIQPILESSSGDAAINVIMLLINETQNIHEHAHYLEQRLEKSTTEIESLQNEHLAFREQAGRDPLTQVLNRNGLKEALRNMTEKNSCFPVSILLADIDHFKAFNDMYGHLVGDKVLKVVASTLKRHVKGSDILVRFGGEEFLLVLPLTKKESGAVVANSLRKRIENLTIKKKNSNENLKSITISIGVAELSADETLNDAIERADKALYRSKNNGRNCVNIN